MRRRVQMWAGLVVPALVGLLAGLSPTISFAALDVVSLGVYKSDAAFDTGGVAVVDYYAAPPTLTAYVVNGASESLDIINLDDPANPGFVLRVDLTVVLATATDGPTDVAVDPLGRGVAVAVSNAPRQEPGWVVFLGLDGSFISAPVVGAFPSDLVFTPDGSKLLVANEGVPSADYLTDPPGSVSILDVAAGFAAPTVTTVSLLTVPEVGPVRHFGPNAANPSLDFEPEVVAVTADGARAYVSLQEHNAVAELDIAGATFVEVAGLGFKDHAVLGQGLDPSDRDDAVAIQNWPVFGMYQPGGVAMFETGGNRYLLTANEGKSRDLTGYSEEAKVADLVLEAPLDPSLQPSALLGRLEVTTTLGDLDSNAMHEALYAFGTRSFSLWDVSAGAPVLTFDSGDAFEQRLAVFHPVHFNSDAASNLSFDRRSDNKGPEPEAVVTGAVCGRDYAHVSLEHMSGVMAFEVTDPTDVRYALYLTSRDFTVAETDPLAGGLGTGGIAYVSEVSSPTGEDLLLVANEVSGTLEIWSVTDPLCGGCAGFGLTARSQLMGVRVGPAAIFQWDLDPNATEYHLQTVPRKTLLDDVYPHRRPIGVGTTQCPGAVLPLCIDIDAVADPEPLLFYQALSACGPSAGAEGPVF